MKSAIRLTIITTSFLWSISSHAETTATQTTVELPHKVRTFVSANLYTDPHNNFKDQWGYGLTSESDTGLGYASVGGSLNYYTAPTEDDTKNMGAESYSRQSDLSVNSYLKIRMPSSYTMFSLYGLVGLALHLVDQRLTVLPEKYQPAYTFGGDYGGGLEFRLSNLYFDFRYLKRVAFDRTLASVDNDEITIGIGIEFFTWSLSETALIPKNLKKTDVDTY